MPSRIEATRRYIALARAVQRARRAAFDPFKLTWILTEQCSQHCRSCNLWVGQPAPGPSMEEIQRLLEANRHLTWLNLSGGDFVERAEAAQIIEAVTHALPDLALLDFPTAGQDTKAVLRALEPALDSQVPRVYVTVSLDGPDDVHDTIRGSVGSAARARETLRALQAIRRPGFTAVAGMTLSSHNLPESIPERLADLLPSHCPPSDLHLNLAHHSTHYYRNKDSVQPPTQTAQALIEFVETARKSRWSPLGIMEGRYWKFARRYLDSGDVGGRCSALRGSVFLGADLSLYPCSIFDRPLGNLRDVSYSLRRMNELAESAPTLVEVEARRCPGCWSPCEAFPTLLVGRGSPL